MGLEIYLKYNIDGNAITVFESRITYNLARMAKEAGIYSALWEPNKMGYQKAKDIIDILEKGLSNLKENPNYFSRFNPPINEYGSYDIFVRFVESYYLACKKYPSSEISVLS